MKTLKKVERSGKRFLSSALKRFLKPSDQVFGIDIEAVSKILLVRQDTRLGNLVLMTPMIAAMRSAFPDSSIDVLISSGMEDVLGNNPDIDELLVFDKKLMRTKPWNYLSFVRDIRRKSYDLAVDVSDGRHFSFNNVMMTALSGATYSLGYDREDAGDLLNILLPPPSPDIHFADALTGLVRALSPVSGEFPMRFHLSDENRDAVEGLLEKQGLSVLDSFCLIHPGGRGKKQWGEENFANLIDRIRAETGLPVLVIAGASEGDIVSKMKRLVHESFPVLKNLSIGQMAALIERCELFISNDTGPMHVASALGRCTVSIFVSSNYRVYGPRGENTRIVAGSGSRPPVDDVLMAIHDLLKNCAS